MDSLPPEGRRVLAYDLAPNFVGYAFGDLSKPWPSDFGFYAFGTGSIGLKMRRFANSLYGDIERWKPSKVVMESPLPPQSQTDTWTAIKIYGQYCYVHEACDRHGIEIPSAAGADTIRSDLIGRCRWPGGSSETKKKVVEFVRSFGVEVRNHNAADAIMVWAWYRLQMLGLPPKPLFAHAITPV